MCMLLLRLCSVDIWLHCDLDFVLVLSRDCVHWVALPAESAESGLPEGLDTVAAAAAHQCGCVWMW